MRRRTSWSALAALALLALIEVFDARMRSTGGPGILGLEFAGSPQRAGEIVGQWGAKGVHAARWANGVDFAFVVAYVVLLTAVARSAWDRARRRRRGRLIRLGTVVVWLPLIAGLFDGVQNVALFLLLGGHAAAIAAPLAFACGAVTSSLALCTLVYAAATAA